MVNELWLLMIDFVALRVSARLLNIRLKVGYCVLCVLVVCFIIYNVYCRVGGYTFTLERYRLELYSVHRFTRSRALDPHTLYWGFLKKTTHTQFRASLPESERSSCREPLGRVCM